ncbi:YDG/SRA domain-containing protein [Streptomyces sp. NPDC026672]|uniref:YDG/SRA domain-containing protein n=1 Tax=unclassified Streptomyces TaxID=2593676 RepID=UPI0033D9CD1C
MIELRHHGAMAERVIGHIDGVVPGEVFEGRAEVKARHLHADLRRGISRLKDADGVYVADAIVLNGGYVDDDDRWSTIQYTGASPDEEKGDGGTLLKSQSWEYRDNAALKLSFERGYHIRIIRGPGGDPRYSLAKRYRYDGLYKIVAISDAISKSPPTPDGSPIQICQFDLERLPGPEQELTQAELKIAEVLEHEEKFPTTRTTRIQRIVRDTAAARRIKELYDHECQMCGTRLVGPDGRPYSQGAHIKPLGAPHGGPDVERNILCLCPNCHVMLDMGAVVIEDDWSIVVRAALFGGRLRDHLKVHRSHKVYPGYVQDHRRYWDARG